MKKLLAIALAAAGAQFALKRRKGKENADVWKQATDSR